MKKNCKRPQARCIILIVFIILYAIVTAFHEPWFDEAQSWQIGKYASISDMLFIIPHDEGHPALWWLILSIPAKLGVPFEIGLKSIGVLISAASVWLIIYESPFPDFIKYTLPFSYFVFYQYGVIVRPYGLMLLVFLLLAAQFKEKNQHPYRFTLLLCVLCMTSAYGLLMAGGIALCMCVEILQEKGFKKAVSEIWKDHRTRALFFLLLAACLIVLQIMPHSNTHNGNAGSQAQNPLWLRLFCMMFTVLPDCLMTQSSWFFTDRTLLQYEEIPLYSLLPCLFAGILLWIGLYFVSSKNTFKYYLVPYCLFACFGAMVYFSGHHIGVALNLLIFWLWIVFEDKNRFAGWRKFKKAMIKTDKDAMIYKRGGKIIIAVCIAIPIYWTIISSIQDIRYEYSYGRETADFLKKTGLDQTTIFCGWNDSRGSLSDQIDKADSQYVSTNFAGTPTLITAYFDHNIVENFNNGQEAYLHQHYNTTEENEKDFETWKKLDPPDVLLDRIDGIEDIFNKKITMNDYSIVYTMKMNYIWKGRRSPYVNYLYVRNDLLDEYHLKPIEDDGDSILPSYNLTSEQMDGLRSGELSLSDVFPFMKNEKFSDGYK